MHDDGVTILERFGIDGGKAAEALPRGR